MSSADPRGEAPRLQAELEAAALRQLLAAWRELNCTHFRDALRPPALGLSDASPLGRWIREHRTIEIARRLVLQQPWGVVLEVLKHEMAHQYVHEVLRALDESAHGPAFRSVCQRLGIDPAASGVPEAQRDAGEQRVLQRIARLLALAESPNLHEAEAAMKEAQRLMLKYNVELEAEAPRRGYGFRHLGPVRGRTSEGEKLVGMILGKHFFVEVIWVRSYLAAEGRGGWVLEACGSPANLEMADYVYGFLTETAERLWREHKRVHRIGGDRDRRTYISGVMLGFDEKLTEQGRRHQQEGLVWRGDAGVHRYLRQRHPRIRHTHSQGHARNEAHEQGRAAGRQLVLHRPVSEGSSGGGRALPPRRH